MKTITEFLLSKSKPKNNTDYNEKYQELFDRSGSSDNTLEKGRITIGFENWKWSDYNANNKLESWDDWMIEFAKQFEEDYEKAGGKLEEEYSSQGAGEVFYNYEGHTHKCKEALLKFLAAIFDPENELHIIGNKNR